MSNRYRNRTRPLSAALIPSAFLLLFFVCCGFSASAQEADSTWVIPDSTEWEDQNADSLWAEWEDEMADFDYTSDLFDHFSSGWFPQLQPASALMFTFPVFYTDVFDRAYDIRPSGFVPTTAPFHWCDPYVGDERDIMKRNSDETEDDPPPVTSYGEYGLIYTFNLPIPLALRFEGALRITSGLLFSHDTTRSYLSLSGIKRPLKEVGTVNLQEYLLHGSAGIQIPIWGVTLDAEATQLSSYYYLHAAVSGSYAVVSNATQYVQIANAKGELRYENGRDTVVQLNDQRLTDLNRGRLGLDAGIGWHFAADIVALDFEIFATIPQSSVLSDADWKQYIVGFRLGVGYQWLPKPKNPF